MKNKKIIIIALIIVIIVAVGLAIVRPFYDSYIFDSIGKEELIEHLKNINNIEQK